MPSIPISKTKVIPPRRREELLTRKRLLDLLFDSLDKRLTLVSAPAGYGKTSLLIDMAHASELPCCWLALDELDREPGRFAAYFIAALSERFPKFGSQSKSALDTMTSFEQGMERLLVTLINELYDQVPEHFILVLDDFHLIEDVQPIQNFINRFVHLVDDNCHLVISSRKVVGLPDMPLLVAREQVSGLDFADLAFLPGEIQALLAQNKGLHISDEEASRLVAETEGWITGLQFSDMAALRKNTARMVMEGSAGLFDYLGQQVLDRQPADLQEFILRTSLMDEFDASLCESALAPLYPQPQDWQNWIRLISRSNMFALPVGEGGRWLRYHHLFRDFIRERFERERPHEVKQVLLRLQQAYEAMGEWERAHHICRQLDDSTALAGLIERASTSMLQSAHLTMESWLNDLPPSLLRTRPGLLSIRGAITYTNGDLHKGLDLLIQADEIYRREGDDSGLNLNLIRCATAYRLLGDYTASLHAAEEVIEATEANDEMQLLHAEALRLKGLALYRLGNARQAVVFLERSLEARRQISKASIPVLLMETGMAYRAIGDFTEARNAYEKALQIWRKEGNLSWQASLLNNLGFLYYFQGEYEKAAFTLEEGLICARRSRSARLDALISIGLGDLYAELEDVDMARQNYLHAADILQEMADHFLRHSLALAQGNLALIQKNVFLVYEAIKEVADAIQSSGSKYENGILNLIYGRAYLLEGKFLKAVESLESAEKLFIEDGRNNETAVARIWLAAACWQDEDRGRAAQLINGLRASLGKNIHAALVAAHQARDWLNGLRDMPGLERSARDLFVQVDRLAIKMPAIRRQLRRQAQVVSSPDPHLTIQAFGHAVVSVGGKSLTISDWQTQSVRDLFFFLLSTEKPLTKEQIGESLWSDLYEPSKLKLRFKNEVYRLRRAVGQEVVLFQDNHYSFNRNLDYEYDVEAFEAFLARAKSTNIPAEKMDFYQKSVDFVRGPYLTDVYADWAAHDRERLGQAYLNALVSLADLYKQHAKYEKSVMTSQQAIAYDPGCEAAYRTAMEAHHRLGDRAAVTRVYQSCRSALQDLFNLPPSKETIELYNRLTT
jgi:ATP/maltotriose-dependent transcriptional regulator MalT/two-component SAPR family response regulator